LLIGDQPLVLVLSFFLSPDFFGFNRWSFWTIPSCFCYLRVTSPNLIYFFPNFLFFFISAKEFLFSTDTRSNASRSSVEGAVWLEDDISNNYKLQAKKIQWLSWDCS